MRGGINGLCSLCSRWLWHVREHWKFFPGRSLKSPFWPLPVLQVPCMQSITSHEVSTALSGLSVTNSRFVQTQYQFSVCLPASLQRSLRLSKFIAVPAYCRKGVCVFSWASVMRLLSNHATQENQCCIMMEWSIASGEWNTVLASGALW